MTATHDTQASSTRRRRRSPAVRQAAARMVVAADRANGKKSDPRIVEIAEHGVRGAQ
jgi:hypothetical protein